MGKQIWLVLVVDTFLAYIEKGFEIRTHAGVQAIADRMTELQQECSRSLVWMGSCKMTWLRPCGKSVANMETGDSLMAFFVFQYCIQVWGPQHKKDVELWDPGQRRQQGCSGAGAARL